MALRHIRGCLVLAALTLAACKGDKAGGSKSGDPAARCEQLVTACGDKAKRSEKLVSECKDAAKAQTDKGCFAKVLTAYDCFEKELCGGTDKVWSLDDLRVLSLRHKKCVAEQTAAAECVGK